MDHELLHVQIAQRALDFGAQTLQRSLDSAPYQHDPFNTGTFGTQEDAFNAWLARQAQKTLEIVREQYAVGNDKLDQPQEGTRMAAMCDAGLRKFLSLRAEHREAQGLEGGPRHAH